MRFILIIAILLGGCSDNEPAKPLEIDSNMQSFAITDKYIYVLDKFYYVSRYDLSGNFIDSGTNLVGHQGLGYDGNLWATDHYESRSAIEFTYQDDVIGRYRLFGDDFSSISSATPTVTDTYLIALGYRQGAPVIRVWYKDFHVSGDYSDKYLYEFTGIDTSPIQGIASDNNHIWIVTGGKYGARHLYTFTLEGQLVDKELLSYEAEPEGLYYHNGLYIGLYDHSTGLATVHRQQTSETIASQ
jgi:hypothetical protein